MEDWQQQFWLVIETATAEVEQFLADVSLAIVELVEQVQDDIAIEIEQFLEDFLFVTIESSDPQPDVIQENIPENFYDEQTDLLINPKINPTPENHPACIGCSHYHGRLYGYNLLVCGMHPYGWDDENCPDWSKDDK